MLLLVAAAGAAVPPIRWCPARWDQIASELFLRCASAADIGAPACAPGSEDGRSPRSRLGGPALCPLASDPAAVPTVAACASRRVCPLAHENPVGASPGGEHRRRGSGHGRAYLLEDPA